jgi:hypothetical protein
LLALFLECVHRTLKILNENPEAFVRRIVPTGIRVTFDRKVAKPRSKLLLRPDEAASDGEL